MRLGADCVQGGLGEGSWSGELYMHETLKEQTKALYMKNFARTPLLDLDSSHKLFWGQGF